MFELAICAIVLILLSIFAKDIRRHGLRGMIIIALLVALASSGRAATQAIPSFQPASFIIITCGIIFGGGAGLVCGVLTAVLSSLLISIGPWTAWQALLWGLMGLLAGRLVRAPVWLTAAYGFVWGFIFGWVMNMWWYTTGVIPLTWATFIARCASSFSFDLIHAATNAVLLTVFSKRSLSLASKFFRERGKR